MSLEFQKKKREKVGQNQIVTENTSKLMKDIKP